MKSETTDLIRPPVRGRWWVPASLASLLVAAIAVSGLAQPVAIPTRLPVVVTYDLTHELYAFDGSDDAAAARLPPGVEVTPRSTVMTTDRFVWTFAGYDDWTFTKVCCSDPLSGANDAGWSHRVSPAGEILYRASADAEWELVGTYDPTEGRTPLPDLSPAPDGGGARPVSSGPWEALGIDGADVRQYERGALLVDVFVPLGIPVAASERDASGDIVRALRVLSLREG